jgi:hypothetical protein
MSIPVLLRTSTTVLIMPIASNLDGQVSKILDTSTTSYTLIKATNPAIALPDPPCCDSAIEYKPQMALDLAIGVSL